MTGKTKENLENTHLVWANKQLVEKVARLEGKASLLQAQNTKMKAMFKKELMK